MAPPEEPAGVASGEVAMKKPSFGKAFLFLLPFAIVGVIVALILSGGKAEGASWGAGAGTVLGLVVGQSMGFFPSKKG